MYQIQVRPNVDRELVASQRSKHPSTTKLCHSTYTGFAVPSPQFSPFKSHQAGLTLLLLMSFAALISGCGGLSSRNGGSLSGTPHSTGVYLAQISCGTQSLVGAQTKACTVDLSATAQSAVQVSLQSNNAALRVPPTVAVQNGEQSAAFNVVSANVNQQLSVTITGTAQGYKRTAAITLYPPLAASPSLTGVSCGSQSLTGPVTEACSVNLSAAATSPVSVALQSNSSYLTVPVSVMIAAQLSSASFKASASAVSSSVTATITASLGGASVSSPIQLNAASGSTSSAQHVVNLSWNPPSSTTDLAGYNVYRSLASASIFQFIGSTQNAQPSYADDTVASGKSYEYEVKSVSSSGTESNPSNITTVSIP